MKRSDCTSAIIKQLVFVVCVFLDTVIIYYYLLERERDVRQLDVKNEELRKTIHLIFRFYTASEKKIYSFIKSMQGRSMRMKFKNVV